MPVQFKRFVYVKQTPYFLNGFENFHPLISVTSNKTLFEY